MAATVWKPRVRNEAHCAISGLHDAPHLDCACGFWALREPNGLAAGRIAGGRVFVVGKVALWGRVIEFERGYRAQYAYPLRLVMARRTYEPHLVVEKAEALRSEYGVPVHIGGADR